MYWKLIIGFALFLISLILVSLLKPEILGNPSTWSIFKIHLSEDLSPSAPSFTTKKYVTETILNEYIGLDGRDVLTQLNSEYPEYRILIIDETTSSLPSTKETIYPMIIKMYVSNSGKVVKVKIN